MERDYETVAIDSVILGHSYTTHVRTKRASSMGFSSPLTLSSLAATFSTIPSTVLIMNSGDPNGQPNTRMPSVVLDISG